MLAPSTARAASLSASALLGRAVGAELAPGQVAEADAMSERDVLGDRAAETDFEIVGMRAKDEQVDGAGHRPILFPTSPARFTKLTSTKSSEEPDAVSAASFTAPRINFFEQHRPDFWVLA